MTDDRWERINSEDDLERTKRLKVFGGWLVLTTVKFSQVGGGECARWETQYSITQSFIPDAEHKWEELS